ncbi:MAG: serine hydrolase domain-containing protein [Limisphaerales bacterium]
MNPVPARSVLSAEACRKAAAYSAQYRGVALIVSVDAQVVFEDYPNEGAPDRVSDLASGTKSFAGIAAVAAVADGLLALDEPLGGRLAEWRDDPMKSRITIRHLLQLVSGIEGGKLGRVPDAATALAARILHPPGERFAYGSSPFQVFGEVLRRAVSGRFTDSLAYIEARVLDPIGMRVGSWRRGVDAQPHWASGAALTAREWLKFGEFVRNSGRVQGREIVPEVHLAECFRGSTDNPCYGLAWWMNRPASDGLRERMHRWTLGVEDLAGDPAIPTDLVYAAGAGKQRLYLSRARDLVVVRQAGGVMEAMMTGDRGGFSDSAFLRMLLSE